MSRPSVRIRPLAFETNPQQTMLRVFGFLAESTRRKAWSPVWSPTHRRFSLRSSGIRPTHRRLNISARLAHSGGSSRIEPSRHAPGFPTTSAQRRCPSTPRMARETWAARAGGRYLMQAGRTGWPPEPVRLRSSLLTLLLGHPARTYLPWPRSFLSSRRSRSSGPPTRLMDSPRTW